MKPNNVFSDEDLKQLKEDLPLVDAFGRWLANGEKLRALIHRLEAAEKIVALTDMFRCGRQDPAVLLENLVLWDEWTKASGKEPKS